MSDNRTPALELIVRQLELARTLESIETAVWTIVVLLLLGFALIYTKYRNQKAERAREQPDWQKIVENAYEKGDYEAALQTLSSTELLFPRSAVVTLWQARCHFQLEAWDNAAEKFEACVRLEPWYRKSVKDWMAFIELNELVPGIEGYLDD